MSDVIGNHVALVKAGRIGPDAQIVGDEESFETRERRALRTFRRLYVAA